MSLLNDALRKRKGEQQQAEGPPLNALVKPGTKARKAKTKQIRIIGACVVLLAAVVGGTWFYRSALSSPSLLASTAPTHYRPGQAVPDTPIVDGSQALPATSSTAASTSPEAAATSAETARPSPTFPPSGGGPEKSAEAAKSDNPEQRLHAEKQAAGHPAKHKAVSVLKRKTSEHSKPPKALLSTPEPDNGQRRLQADRLYQQACVFHRRGRLDQAIALYQEVIKIDPEHQNARFNMGAAYLQTGAYDQAYYIMSDLHLKDPDNRQVTLNLAIAAIGRRQFNDALNLLDKAAAGQMSPSFEIALHKGIVYKHLNQPGVALDWYKRAEAMRPDDPRLLFNVAVVLDQQQRYSEAIDYYTRYIEHTTDKKDAEALQVRRRIRILRAYRAPENPKESITQ